MSYRITPELLDELIAALERWELAVDEADLSIRTKHTYVQHPRRFVRWLAGEYHLPPLPEE